MCSNPPALSCQVALLACADLRGSRVASVKYNAFHERLLISAGTDGCVFLSNLASLSKSNTAHEGKKCRWLFFSKSILNLLSSPRGGRDGRRFDRRANRSQVQICHISQAQSVTRLLIFHCCRQRLKRDGIVTKYEEQEDRSDRSFLLLSPLAFISLQLMVNAGAASVL